jgi:DNA-binding MarR family transcriptional regulator
MTGEAGQYAYAGLDRVIHERARLSILTSLVAHPRGLVFGDLRRLCDLSDGNLSRHLQVLQAPGFVEVIKSFHKNRPQTMVQVTAAGRAAYLAYLAELEQVVRDAAAAMKAATTAGFGSADLPDFARSR